MDMNERHRLLVARKVSQKRRDKIHQDILLQSSNSFRPQIKKRVRGSMEAIACVYKSKKMLKEVRSMAQYRGAGIPSCSTELK
jgi:hypothetical protein